VTEEEIEFEIICERKFIDRMRARIDYLIANNDIVGDIVPFETAITNAEARISLHQKNLEALK